MEEGHSGQLSMKRKPLGIENYYEVNTGPRGRTFQIDKKLQLI